MNKREEGSRRRGPPARAGRGMPPEMKVNTGPMTVDCRGDALCVRWFERFSLPSTMGKYWASFGWSTMNSRTELSQAFTFEHNRLVPHFHSTSGLALIDAHTTMSPVAADGLITGGHDYWLVHAPLESVVLPGGVVLSHRQNSSSKQILILDFSGGCCRTHGQQPPVNLKRLFEINQKPVGAPGWVRKRDLRHLATEAIGKKEYDWIFTVVQSHGSTYYHAMVEVVPRVLWGMRLLRAVPQIRVVSSSPIAAMLLDLLGIANPALNSNGKPIFARTVTIPPPGTPENKRTQRLQTHMLRSLRTEIASHSSAWNHHTVGLTNGGGGGDLGAAPTILVVRRAAAVKRRTRAMLNHDEVMATLGRVLSIPKEKDLALTEWPPEASLPQAVAVWGRTRLAIAPHGAGGTNILFMPSGSTFVEIIAGDQKGRVYGSLATSMGHRYVPCIYNRSDTRFQPQLPRALKNTDNFIVNVPWLLRCVRDGLQAIRGKVDDPLSMAAWMRVDQMINGSVTTPSNHHVARTAEHRGKGSVTPLTSFPLTHAPRTRPRSVAGRLFIDSLVRRRDDVKP